MAPDEDADPKIDFRLRLTVLERAAEKSYDLMYDARTPTDAAAHYSDAKEALHDAIGIARRAGFEDTAKRLEQRLAHIKAVFRSQFT